MPKLVYLPLQGRIQAVRFMLAAKGVAFEDVRLTFEEWGAAKAAGTYGAGNQLPVYIADDGKIFNQSIAILKMVAHEHGYGADTASQEYEAEFFYATFVDIMEKPARFAIMRDDADADAQQAAIELLRSFMKKCDDRMADGRPHVAGDKMTHADFGMLALITSHYENPNGKHAAIREATAAMMSEFSNVARVMAPMRELCAAQIANLSGFI